MLLVRSKVVDVALGIEINWCGVGLQLVTGTTKNTD